MVFCDLSSFFKAANAGMKIIRHPDRLSWTMITYDSIRGKFFQLGEHISPYPADSPEWHSSLFLCALHESKTGCLSSNGKVSPDDCIISLYSHTNHLLYKLALYLCRSDGGRHTDTPHCYHFTGCNQHSGGFGLCLFHDLPRRGHHRNKHCSCYF